uniref:Uncharacterized protein n=1 Tax=Enterobacter phage vB_EclP_26 TaxID=3161160 RepID=A0AAU7VGZ0_9CAUD
MIAYKIFRIRKDGTLGALFINRKAVIEVGEWYEAESHPTKGFAYRPGWHCTFEQNAPHLKLDLKSGERRAWFKVEVEDITTYDRPESQGGAWVLAQRLKVLEQVSE